MTTTYHPTTTQDPISLQGNQNTMNEHDHEREIAKDFEQLCRVGENDDRLKDRLQSQSSPNSVLDYASAASAVYRKGDGDKGMSLPGKLQGKLSQEEVDRVAFYSVVHDMNCESIEMSRQDQYTFQKLYQPTIDEERWLLHVISNRQSTIDKGEDAKASSQPPSPTSFLEAIGESTTAQNNTDTDTPNPLICVSHSRTHLWKPSRSWWEAKSGKNPWIEPRLHSRRWRFLWPLIRYHKFLARCIKKLKRCGVGYNDGGGLPKFLRKEVVSISNHLARLSEFTSEEWTEGLTEFHSWYYCKDCDFAEFYHFSPIVPSHGSSSRGGVFQRLSSRQQHEESSKQMGFHEQLLLSREEGSLFPPRTNNDTSDKNNHKKNQRSSNVHTNGHCTPTRSPRRNKKNFTPPSSTKHRRNHHSNRYHYPSYYDDYGRVMYPSAEGYPYALPPPPYYHPHAHASSPNPFMHPTFGSVYHSSAHAHMYRDEYWTSSSHYQGPPQCPPPHSGVVNNNSVYYTSLDDSFDQKNWGHLDPMQALASPTRSLHNCSYVNNESVSDDDDAENKDDKGESDQENVDVPATPRRNKKY